MLDYIYQFWSSVLLNIRGEIILLAHKGGSNLVILLAGCFQIETSVQCPAKRSNITVSQVMADKAKSFILAPSRLGRNPTESEDSHATAKPNFTGG